MKDRNIYYTGVGSRNVPQDIVKEMHKLAGLLAEKGYLLRSGGAQGSDTAFYEGAKAAGGHGEIYKAHHATPEALAYVATVHPAWERCGSYARKLHARNAFQVLGRDMKGNLSRFVLCWTPDGAQTEDECSINTGGTATAIRIADRHDIPVFNLARPGAQVKFAFMFA